MNFSVLVAHSLLLNPPETTLLPSLPRTLYAEHYDLFPYIT
jgi:hypothetical protein